MASTLYKKGLDSALSAGIDFVNDTIKVAFMAPSFTANATTQQYYSDISSSIASGSTDTTLASKTVSGGVFDAGDISLATQTITGGTNKLVIYKWTGTAGTSPLIACIDIAEGTLIPISGTLAITWNASGIFKLNVV